MPSNATQFLSHSKLIRMCLWGDPKTQKTWWAMRSAERGYNVLLIDGDDGAWAWPLEGDALSRINIVSCVDDLNKATYKNFMELLASPRNMRILWNQQLKQSEMKTKPEYDYIFIDKSKLCPRDVIVVDSWKALVASAAKDYAATTGIDLSDAAKEEWDGYGWQGRFLNYIINSFHQLQSQIICINHGYEYAKRAPGKGGKKVGDIKWTKQIPVSSSSNHSFSTVSHWTDMVYMEKTGPITIKARTDGDLSRLGGCRNYEPGCYSWSAIHPADFFEKVSGPADTYPECSSAIAYIPAGGPEMQREQIVVSDGVASAVSGGDDTPASGQQLAGTGAPKLGNVGRAAVSPIKVGRLTPIKR